MTSTPLPTTQEPLSSDQILTIDHLQSDLHKSKLQINKLESTIQKLQSQLSSFSTNSNNTSNSFLLPSEFKQLWNSLGKENIMEGFENVFNISVLLSHMVQETFLLTYQEASLIIDNKLIEIKNVFNLNDSICSKERFYSKIKPFFIEFFSSMFDTENEYTLNVNNIITKLGMSIYKRQIAKYFNKEISLDLDSDNLKMFIRKSLKLCFYMHLHNPKLDISILPFEKRDLQYNYYNKFSYVSIEGFENENSPCLIILPPPMLNNQKGFTFQGLKPFVYIITDPDEKIMELCEEQRIKNGNILKHSKSYGGSECKMNQEKKEDKEEQETHQIINNHNTITNKENEIISNNIENVFNKKSRNKCMVTSSSTSVLKKSNIYMNEMNDFYIEHIHNPSNTKHIYLTQTTGIINNIHKNMTTLNIKQNSNTIITNSHSSHPYIKHHAISRNLPSSHLYPSNSHNKIKNYDYNSNTIVPMNSIEKEINFDFICHKTTDAIPSQHKTSRKVNNHNNSINHNDKHNMTNPKYQSNSSGLLFNSDKIKQTKTKAKIRNCKPKCFNVKCQGINNENASNNSIYNGKKVYKKIGENTLNNGKKSLPTCFSNEMLRYGNVNNSKSNNSSINVPNGNEINNKRKDNCGILIKNELSIMSYNNKKQTLVFPNKKNKHVI